MNTIMIYMREKMIQDVKDACFVLTMCLLVTTLFTVLFMWIGLIDTNEAVMYTIKLYVKASYIMLSISLAVVIIEVINAVNIASLRIKQLTSYQIQDQ